MKTTRRIWPVALLARIEDLGSANGTLVNGARIVEIVELGDGDVIRLSETDL